VDGEAHAVAQICQLVGGLPLAIELAAATLRTRSIAAIAEAIKSSGIALASGLRAVPERQRSIWATFEHSWRLLSDEEQLVFARLSVFRGGFEEESAAQVAQATPELLTALMDKSLLRWDGATRYDMHELVRQYAGEKLGQGGETVATQARHAEYFQALAETAEPHLFRAEQLEWLDQLEVEHNNLRAALAWNEQERAVEPGLRLASALHWFWVLQGYSREGWTWLEHALARSGDVSAPVRAKALRGAGVLAQRNDDVAIAGAFLEESLALYRSLADRRGMARTLGLLSWQAFLQGDQAALRAYLAECELLYRALDDTWGIAYSLLCKPLDTSHQVDAQALLEKSLALFRRVGDRWGIGAARNNLGLAAFVRGDYEQAQRYMEEGLVRGPEFGERASIGGTYVNLGYVAHAQGDLAKMRACFAESLQIGREFGDRGGIADVLGGVGGAVGLAGQPLRAARLFGASDALFEAIGQVRDPAFAAAYERFVADVRAQVDAAAFAAAYAAGQALTLEQAIAYALEVSDVDAEQQALITAKQSG
jgi:tetratricopeptide (TPR) repeat protein